MIEINIKKIAGKNTATRDDGEKIYNLIKEKWSKEDKIVVNFSSLVIASVSFIDEAFGQLALDYSKEELQKKLDFKEINQHDRALLNNVILSRVKQKDILGKRDKKRTK